MSVSDRWHKDEEVWDEEKGRFVKTGKRVPSTDYGRVKKRWQVRVPGVPVKSFEKKKDADSWDTEVKAKKASGVKAFDQRKGKIRVAEYCRKKAQARYSNPRSLRSARSTIDRFIEPFFKSYDMSDVERSDAEAWVEWLNKQRKKGGEPYAPSSICQAIDWLASYMKTATLIDRVIPENPAYGLMRPAGGDDREILDFWDQVIVDTIVGEVERVAPRFKVLPIISATCGHRQGESFGVAVEDVDFLRKRITIRHQVQRDDNGRLALCPPKGGKRRVVPLPESAAFALSESIRVYGVTPATCTCCKGTVRLIVTRPGGRLMDRAVFNRSTWNPAVAAAVKAVPEDTPGYALLAGDDDGQHQLRHYFASLLIDGGATPAEVQRYMGHSAITTTMKLYTHLFDRANDRARAIVDGAFSASVYRTRTADDR